MKRYEKPVLANVDFLLADVILASVTTEAEGGGWSEGGEAGEINPGIGGNN